MKKRSVEIYSPQLEENMELLFIEEGVHAGFPNPAQDNITLTLDLNRELIHHPSATFFARVVGTSMEDAGISEGDLLVIDRSIEPQTGHIAVCFIDGEFTLKYIQLDEKEKGIIWLVPANSKFSKIKVTKENDFLVWGIVSYSIKNRIKK